MAACAAAHPTHAPPRRRCLWSTLWRRGLLLNGGSPSPATERPWGPARGPSVQGGRFRKAKTTADTCLGGPPGPLSPERRSCCRCVCCVFRVLEVIHPNVLQLPWQRTNWLKLGRVPSSAFRDGWSPEAVTRGLRSCLFPSPHPSFSPAGSLAPHPGAPSPLTGGCSLGWGLRGPEAPPAGPSPTPQHLLGCGDGPAWAVQVAATSLLAVQSEVGFGNSSQGLPRLHSEPGKRKGS